MKLQTYSIALILSLTLFMHPRRSKAQTPLYCWTFDTTGERLDYPQYAIYNYFRSPYLSWGCEGIFTRGCIHVFNDISTDCSCGAYLSKFFGVGVRRDTSTSSKALKKTFLAVGTPIDPMDYVVWSHKVPLDPGENYIFKCYVKNLNKSHSEGQPYVKLQIQYLDGPKKGTLQDITSYHSIASNSSKYKWDSLQGAWRNNTSCHVNLEVISNAPDGYSNVSDTAGFILGMDSITLSMVCALNVPTQWCVSTPMRLRMNMNADTAMDSIQWYVNNSRIYHYSRDSSSYTKPDTLYTFTSTNPATKVKVIRYFMHGIVDSCVSYINVLPTPSASFSVLETFEREQQITNSSTSASAYSWYCGYLTGHSTSTATNPTFNLPSDSDVTDTIKLSASGICGTATSSQTITLCTWSPRLTIDTVSIHNLTVKFRAQGFFDTSSYTGLRYFWSFGDGTYSAALDSSPTISHTYAVRGIYVARLVSTRLGCGMDTSSYFLNLCPDTTSFSQDADSICFGDSVHVQSPYANAVSYKWYVNNDFMSAAQNTYLRLFNDTANAIKLVINTGCNLDTLYSNVYMSPQNISQFSYSTNYPNLILKPAFLKGSSYYWQVTTISGAPLYSSSSKNYTVNMGSNAPGTFIVYLTVTFKGCTKTSSLSVCLQQDIRNCCQGCSTSN